MPNKATNQQYLVGAHTVPEATGTIGVHTKQPPAHGRGKVRRGIAKFQRRPVGDWTYYFSPQVYTDVWQNIKSLLGYGQAQTLEPALPSAAPQGVTVRVSPGAPSQPGAPLPNQPALGPIVGGPMQLSPWWKPIAEIAVVTFAGWEALNSDDSEGTLLWTALGMAGYIFIDEEF